MTILAQTACLRCRGQKLRCSRDLPICARCKRLNANCTFPDPPERRTKYRQQSRLHESSTTPEDEISERSATRSIDSLSRNNSDDGGLPHDLQVMLIDIFFSSFYNATLLFHRTTFIHAYSQGHCPNHTLLSIFAMAVNFIRLPSLQATYDPVKLNTIDEALGLRCAKKASDEVLKDIDNPSLDSARTCLVLCMYWFSRGDIVRNGMFSSISMRAARSVYQASASDLSKPWLALEIERRVVWSAWWAYITNSDDYVNGSSADTFILNLPLPVSPEAFEQCRPELVSCLADTSDAQSSGSSSSSTNLAAELSRLFLHWARINDHIEASKRGTAKESLVRFLDLDLWLSNWIRRMATNFKYSKRSLYERAVTSGELLYPLLHTTLHLCRMVLHTSIVPQFGGCTTSDASPEMVRISVQTALNNANAIATLASDMLELGIDPGQLAPILGHCMYVSATIHMTFLSSSHKTLVSNARTGLTATMSILKLMKPYWTSLRRLWSHVLVLYEEQISRTISGERLAVFHEVEAHSGTSGGGLDYHTNTSTSIEQSRNAIDDMQVSYTTADNARMFCPFDETNSQYLPDVRATKEGFYQGDYMDNTADTFEITEADWTHFDLDSR